jgi:DNA polymerase III psi subunit
MMSAAMDYATTNTSLNSWARTYMFTLSFVYTQIETVAFAVNGVLTGSAPTSSGFDMTDRDKVLAINKAMLKEMGKYKTSDDYVKKFLMKNIDQASLSTNGVGKAILRQAELVAPYSAAMEVEFKKDPDYKSITSALKAFLASTGTKVNSINSMKSWLELNTLTGILHGSAFSLLRLLNTHSIMSVNSIDSTTFTLRDAKFLRGLNAVTLGTHEAFYAFSDHLPSVNPYDINKVLKFFDLKTTALKDRYQAEITQNTEEYKRFGWILSDHGPNFKDGKQLSHSGYF